MSSSSHKSRLGYRSSNGFAFQEFAKGNKMNFTSMFNVNVKVNI